MDLRDTCGAQEGSTTRRRLAAAAWSQGGEAPKALGGRWRHGGLGQKSTAWSSLGNLGEVCVTGLCWRGGGAGSLEQLEVQVQKQ